MGARYTALPDLEAESLARAVLRVARPD